MSNQDTYLNTGLSQIETTKIIIDKIEYAVEYLTYNIRRYKIPVSLVLFYSEVDISRPIDETKRLTDVLIDIKIGDSHFNFILLPFTDETESYSFVKHVEKNKLNHIKHYYYYEMLEPQVYNYFNFVNSYLFHIIEKVATNSEYPI